MANLLSDCLTSFAVTRTDSCHLCQHCDVEVIFHSHIFVCADLKVPAPVRPDRYFGVEGKVIQAQGLHVAHVAQLYCRIKLQR
jgi:hypothetical protein